MKKLAVVTIFILQSFFIYSQNISTIAGISGASPTPGFSGDGGNATAAELDDPAGIAIDNTGNIYFSDSHNFCVRKINGSGNISEFAGTPSIFEAYPPKTQAGPCWQTGINPGYYNKLTYPAQATGQNAIIFGRGLGIALDPTGTYLYIADEESMAIWQVNISAGTVNLFAGNCSNCDEWWFTSMNVAPATLNPQNLSATNYPNANLYYPSGVAVDNNGNVFIADQEANVILEVPAANGTNYGIPMQKGDIYTVAGNGYYTKQTNVNDSYLTGGFSGDGGPATNAELYWPRSVAVDNAGNIYISDMHNNRIRKVNPLGNIVTIAGNGVAGFSGDGGSAVSAEISSPNGITLYGGNLYIADQSNNRIRMVSGGIISTVAGNGTMGYSGDGGNATAAELAFPSSVAFDASGNMFITDFYNSAIRKVH